MTTDLIELNPASDNCQRWRNHQHSWRHRSEGGFNPDDYTIEPLTKPVAKAFVVTHHYSGCFPSDKLNFGLFDRDGQLVGVLVYSTPGGPKVLSRVFPELKPSYESIELGRLVLLDEVPGNAESWFIAQCAREAQAVGIAAVLSMSDPTPRVLDGRIIMPGHIGTIYQATNALYIGRATARYLTVLPDGTIFNDMAKQKIRKQKRGHVYAEKQLMAFGARPMRAGEKPAAWMNEVIRDIGCTTLKHRGNHRYVFPLGNRTQRRHLHIVGSQLPYPKEIDAA